MKPTSNDSGLAARNLVTSLIMRSAGGDQTAFCRLHASTRNKMRQAALSVLPSAADIDDVLQEAYLKIWRHADSFDPAKSSPISWMSVIVRNTALDTARRRKLPTTALELAPDIPIVTDDTDDFDYVLARSVVDRVLADLPDDRRRLLSLAYLEGYSREALSQMFDAPKSTIKTWLRRTLESVKVDCAELVRRPGVA